MKVNADKVFEKLLKESKKLKGDMKYCLEELAEDIGNYPEEYPTAESIIEYCSDILSDSVDMDVITEKTKKRLLTIVKRVLKG
jgi:hypothetical protein